MKHETTTSPAKKNRRTSLYSSSRTKRTMRFFACLPSAFVHLHHHHLWVVVVVVENVLSRAILYMWDHWVVQSFVQVGESRNLVRRSIYGLSIYISAFCVNTSKPVYFSSRDNTCIQTLSCHYHCHCQLLIWIYSGTHLCTDISRRDYLTTE